MILIGKRGKNGVKMCFKIIDKGEKMKNSKKKIKFSNAPSVLLSLQNIHNFSDQTAVIMKFNKNSYCEVWEVAKIMRNQKVRVVPPE